ncbi:MAG TPA: hypothetical protein VLH16_07365 [Bacteroidales bacterium]|nr:hypothetical protein [Bacteroidales bacterium]
MSSKINLQVTGVILVLSVLLSGCNIEEIVYEENPFVRRRNVLSFDEIHQSRQVVSLTDSVHFIARAAGDSLQFVWSSNGGEITSSDSTAVFNAIEPGLYTVTCLVSDKYGDTITKSVVVHVTIELVFNGISATDTIAPPAKDVVLTANAAGQDVTFQWHSPSGGQLTTEGAFATFNTTTVGIYPIVCTVTDKAGEVITQQLTLTITDNLIFKSLSADPPEVQVGKLALIRATAFGQGLTYQWRSNPPANILGFGAEVFFTMCHADLFTVVCTVRDNKGNSESKEIIIRVYD